MAQDIAAAIEFFTELGLELEGRAPIEGEWATLGSENRMVPLAYIIVPGAYVTDVSQAWTDSVHQDGRVNETSPRTLRLAPSSDIPFAFTCEADTNTFIFSNLLAEHLQPAYVAGACTMTGNAACREVALNRENHDDRSFLWW